MFLFRSRIGGIGAAGYGINGDAAIANNVFFVFYFYPDGPHVFSLYLNFFRFAPVFIGEFTTRSPFREPRMFLAVFYREVVALVFLFQQVRKLRIQILYQYLILWSFRA